MQSRHLAPLLSLVSIVALACTGDRGPVPDTSAAASAATATAKGRAPEPAWTFDPTEECGTDSTPGHPDPVALVREFVERDSRGEGAWPDARADAWRPVSLLCPDHVGGPDAFEPIDTMYVLESQAVVRGDTAWVPVRYMLLGVADNTFFEPTKTPVVVDTFVVARMPFGWRVHSPSQPFRIRVAVATDTAINPGMSDSLRTVLRAAAAASRARSAGDGAR